MGIIAFFLLIVLVCALAALTSWAISYFAPSAPGVIHKIIWGVAILIIVVVLLRALGVQDVAIPRL